MVKISSVDTNSPAEQAGIMAGDELISISGNAVRDVLDYMFYVAEEFVEIEIRYCERRIR